MVGNRRANLGNWKHLLPVVLRRALVDRRTVLPLGFGEGGWRPQCGGQVGAGRHVDVILEGSHKVRNVENVVERPA